MDFCKQNNKRLIHISTISISGFGEKDTMTSNISETNSQNFTEKIYMLGKILKEFMLLQNIKLKFLY